MHCQEIGTSAMANSPSPCALTFPNRCQKISDYHRFPARSAQADLLAAATSHEQAIMGASHDDRACAWRQWQQWLELVGCAGHFLDSFSQVEWNLLLGAFAMAVREGWFSRDCSEPLVEGTVHGTISHVAQAFWEWGRQNPTKDADTCLASFYQGSSGPIGTTIPRKCNKRPFHSSSSMN